MAKIVLTGGGTAGHIIPNLALLPELKKYFDYIYYIGGQGMENNLVSTAGIPFYSTTTVKLERDKIFSNLKIPFSLAKGISEAKDILERIRPDVIFSKGGYVALPTCLAAKRLKIPIVVHESDYSLGIANKITATFADKLLVSFPETSEGIFVGNPIREEILKGQKERALKLYPIDLTLKTILVFGGSLGAEYINNILYKSLPQLESSFNIIHITGKNGKKMLHYKNYFQIEYSDNINDLYALSDLVVCRSGANTLTEIACLGKRCITIPLPKGTSRGDQLLNAESFAKSGYVQILRQEDLCVEKLIFTINESLKKTCPKNKSADKINAEIVKHILSVIK